MADSKPEIIEEYLPPNGLVYSEKTQPVEILCKPKILPIKSMTLERLEKIEIEARQAFGRPGTSRVTTARRPFTAARPGSARIGTAKSNKGPSTDEATTWGGAKLDGAMGRAALASGTQASRAGGEADVLTL